MEAIGPQDYTCQKKVGIKIFEVSWQNSASS